MAAAVEEPHSTQPSTPIAVVGVACRCAGSDTAEEFWAHVRDSRCLISDVPEDRVPGLAELSGSMYVPPRAGLMDGVDRFDADFFGVKRAIAPSIDPQHRMLLEAGWQALENAGIAPSTLAGRDVAVFAGVSSYDYRELAVRTDRMTGFLLSGTLHTFAANQLSYHFDLRGPSNTVDAACSSGLSALALAVTALRTGQCEAALVGAANLICNGFYFASLSRAGVLAPSGRSVAFDNSSAGYIRGEGVACLVLKRLPDAIADGDPIQAVIAGAAANHDGHSATLTGPSASSQAAAIRSALADAGVPAGAVGYVEAHGTGTKAGDRAEMAGLVQGLSLDQAVPAGPEDRLWVGAVKANIGHTEGTSGLFGLIKTVYMLRDGVIPAIPGFTAARPELRLQDFPVRIADKSTDWVGNGTPRVAGVNGFGLGGANVHLVVTESPANTMTGVPHTFAVPLSAADEPTLERLATRLARHLRAHPAPLPDLCWTLQSGRDHLACRRLVLPRNAEDLLSALDAIGEGERHALVVGPQDPATADGAFGGELAGWCSGDSLDWSRLWKGHARPRRMPLTPYPFAGQSYWLPGIPPPDRVPALTPQEVAR